jgi:hypothetical protein
VASVVDAGKRRQRIIRPNAAEMILIVILQDVLGDIGEIDPVTLHLLDYLLLTDWMRFVKLGYSIILRIPGHLCSPHFTGSWRGLSFAPERHNISHGRRRPLGKFC